MVVICSSAAVKQAPRPAEKTDTRASEARAKRESLAWEMGEAPDGGGGSAHISDVCDDDDPDASTSEFSESTPPENDSVPIEEDGTITAQERVATFLGIDEEWARTCIEAEAKRRKTDERASAATSEGARSAAGSPGVLRPDADEEAKEVDHTASTTELENLLDLHDADLPVAWPRGLDPRVARIILRNRLATPDG